MTSLLENLNWMTILKITIIDILLSGDNAVVIALLCRNLPEKQRLKGVLLGAIAAIVLRVILIFFAFRLLNIPFLKVFGSLLLFWIGLKILSSQDGFNDIKPADKLWVALKSIIVVDFVMSVDNVIALAGATQEIVVHYRMPFVIFGLFISIPLIVCGSQIVMKLLDRFPLVRICGAVLMGWIAGGLWVTDKGITEHLQFDPDRIYYAAAFFGALFMMGFGIILKKWKPVDQASASAKVYNS
ncbi:TerC family protein [Candidatus Pandoraea novymonadis]|uniref:Integral membrane protein TerC n=1 Tax=Candidatus Pandoraea novymonadis TaxID=1808959 RepID=A0ABX5FFY0_9BURK|nr:TerC family protein [Candidatus Pandoraea novymonadis]PSB92355.1 hypothetical protein BZL35_00595 [Candidatus Pandoraea novymonadis]